MFETDDWWVRLWDYPRLQIAGLIVVGLIGLLLVGPRNGRAFWIAIGGGFASLAWQLWQVAPYMPRWPVELKAATACDPGRQLRLLNANVLMTNQGSSGAAGVRPPHGSGRRSCCSSPARSGSGRCDPLYRRLPASDRRAAAQHLWADPTVPSCRSKARGSAI